MLRCALLLALSIGLTDTVHAQEAPDRTLVRGEIENLEPLEVVDRLLPSALAGSVDLVEIRPTTFIRPGFRMWAYEPAGLTDRGVCVRRQYRYDVDTPYPYPETTLDVLAAGNERVRLIYAIPSSEGCPSIDGYVVAQEGLAGELQQESMVWLAEIVSAARNDDGVDVEIHCRTDEDGRCDDHLQALGSLPLDLLRNVSVSGPSRLVTSSSGREYRQATPVVDRSNRNVVRITFDYDGGACRCAWQVSWSVENGNVTGIRLWRARVVYH